MTPCQTPRAWHWIICVTTQTALACSFSPSQGNPLPDAAPADCTDTSLTCVGDMLRACEKGAPPTLTPCEWGCRSDPAPAHCGQLVPAGGAAVPADVSATFDALGDVTLDGDPSTIDGDNGEIDGNQRADVVWSPRETQIGMHPVAVFRFKSLTINGPVRLVGGRSIVLIADGAITIDDVVTAKGTCGNDNAAAPAGPGGFAGSLSANNGAQGPGAGGGGPDTNQGGGGGGNAAEGGSGGNVTAANGGGVIGDDTIPFLVGGGGGGAGDGGGGFGQGGGGGGAVQLISNTAIVFGAGGGIDAGGCGGAGGGGGGDDGGGGGGAGGTILLEAPEVTGPGRLAVNGGGGGGGGDTDAVGASGSLTRSRAAGGAGSGGGGMGGVGGAGMFARGDNGAGTSGNDGGGGGGAIGRIRINTRSGTHEISGELSPQVGETGFSVAKPKTQ